MFKPVTLKEELEILGNMLNVSGGELVKKIRLADFPCLQSYGLIIKSSSHNFNLRQLLNVLARPES